MLKATAGKLLPTTITGSLPRPSWYTENLGTRSFLDAMVTSRFREQYVDALVGHSVSTVQGLGWAGTKNGALLKRASGVIDALVTMDTNLEHGESMID